MDYSISFARHFARLVWLLTQEDQNAEEQKGALKAAVLASSDGAITLALEGSQLSANGVPLAEGVGPVRELAQRFVTHEVRELNGVVGATAAEFLNAARTLAEDPTLSGDAGTAAERLAATGAQSVWFLTGRPTAIPLSELTAARGRDSHLATPATKNAPTAVMRGARAMIAHFVPTTPSASAQELLERLDSAAAGAATMRALEDLTRFAEAAVQAGKPGPAADALAGIVRRESSTQDEPLKELYSFAITRLSTPPFLRALAALLPGARERTSDYAAILLRAGEKGADALIEELTKAQGREELQVLFDVLLQLRPDASPFLHMLGDARWYVVRNAAEVLGTMKATQADSALAALLRHEDERVRRAAAWALAQIDTPLAVDALQQIIVEPDSTAAVREEAVSALSRRRGERTSAITLSRALDTEAEPQVQFAILAALGKVGTAEAIDRLIKAAESDGILFSKKSIPFRIAAVRALGETRSPAALAALKALLEDRTPEVREAAAAFLRPKDGSQG